MTCTAISHLGSICRLRPRSRPKRQRSRSNSCPDPSDMIYQVDHAVILREADGSAGARHDRYIKGFFARRTWLDLLADVDFAQTRDGLITAG